MYLLCPTPDISLLHYLYVFFFFFLVESIIVYYIIGKGTIGTIAWGPNFWTAFVYDWKSCDVMTYDGKAILLYGDEGVQGCNGFSAYDVYFTYYRCLIYGQSCRMYNAQGISRKCANMHTLVSHTPHTQDNEVAGGSLFVPILKDSVQFPTYTNRYTMYWAAKICVFCRRRTWRKKIDTRIRPIRLTHTTKKKRTRREKVEVCVLKFTRPVQGMYEMNFNCMTVSRRQQMVL